MKLNLTTSIVTNPLTVEADWWCVPLDSQTPSIRGNTYSATPINFDCSILEKAASRTYLANDQHFSTIYDDQIRALKRLISALRKQTDYKKCLVQAFKWLGEGKLSFGLNVTYGKFSTDLTPKNADERKIYNELVRELIASYNIEHGIYPTFHELKENFLVRLDKGDSDLVINQELIELINYSCGTKDNFDNLQVPQCLDQKTLYRSGWFGIEEFSGTSPVSKAIAFKCYILGRDIDYREAFFTWRDHLLLLRMEELAKFGLFLKKYEKKAPLLFGEQEFETSNKFNRYQATNEVPDRTKWEAKTYILKKWLENNCSAVTSGHVNNLAKAHPKFGPRTLPKANANLRKWNYGLDIKKVNIKTLESLRNNYGLLKIHFSENDEISRKIKEISENIDQEILNVKAGSRK